MVGRLQRYLPQHLRNQHNSPLPGANNVSNETPGLVWSLYRLDMLDCIDAFTLYIFYLSLQVYNSGEKRY